MPSYFPTSAVACAGLAGASVAVAVCLPETPYLVPHWRPWVLWLSGAWAVGRVLVLAAAMAEYRAWHVGRAWHLVPDAPSVPDRPMGEVLLGRAFRWEPQHTQVLEMALATVGALPLDPGPRGGYPVLHAVGRDVTAPLVLPPNEVARHMLVTGTPGSGKTRELELLATEAISQPGCTILIDPSGDRDLMVRACYEARRHGKPWAFISPAFPAQSSTVNVLGTATTVSEVAERIHALMPSAGGRSANPFFELYPLTVLQHVATVQAALGQPWTLKGLYEATMLRHHMGELLRDYLTSLGCVDPKGHLTAQIGVYRKAHLNDSAADALLEDYEHDVKHFREVTTNLAPTFTGLVDPPLDRVFSSVPADISWHQIVQDEMVVYVQLASMLKGELANRIGRVIIQDLIGYLGWRYAYEDVRGAKPMTILVDELRQVLYPQFTTALAMSRRANCRWILAQQSHADAAAALGPDQARVLFDNCRTKLYFGLADHRTAEEAAKGLGMCSVYVPETRVGLTVGGVGGLTGNSNRGFKEKPTLLVRPEWLLALPVGEFYGQVQGVAWKGQAPLFPAIDEATVEELGLGELWRELDPVKAQSVHEKEALWDDPLSDC